MITGGEVISWVSTKFKLALNNWTKTFQWTLYLKKNWCKQVSWWLIWLSSWTAGIWAASSSSTRILKMQGLQLPPLFENSESSEESPRISKASNWKQEKESAPNPTDSENRDECYSEDQSLRLSSYSCCLRISVCLILATWFLLDAMCIGRLGSV